MDKIITKLNTFAKSCGLTEQSEMIWDKIEWDVKNTKSVRHCKQKVTN